jgi:Ca2+-transporting ATPase
MADAVVILGVVIANAYIGYKSEVSAEKTIQHILRIPKLPVQVVRDGTLREISIEEIVKGDLLVLTPGLIVPADARVLKADRLSVDESSLTGESLPALKSADTLAKKIVPLGDRTNMIYQGTTVTGGGGLAVVVATGGQTQFGKIQILMGESRQPETVFQHQLRVLGHQMVGLAFAFSGTIFLIGILRGHPFSKIVKTSLSLAIAAIPESLPTIATTTLARGARNLQTQGILVRRLSAIESLSGVDTVCFDKTGTLTVNQMSVTCIAMATALFEMTDKGVCLEGKPISASRKRALTRILEIISLCNEAKVIQKDTGLVFEGSATESALLRIAFREGVNPDKILKKYPRLSIRYRTENRSWMTTVHRYIGKKRLIAVKGRPDVVLSKCKFYKKDSKTAILTQSKRNSILDKNNHLASQSLRVLGVAYRLIEGDQEVVENELIWLGLVGLADPLRPELEALMPLFHSAGIKTMMVTGDQKSTALAVGKTLGLNGKEPLRLLDASDLEVLNLEELEKIVDKVHIFSRVSPGHKLKIVQALQKAGKVVAMTGDGINDGPALRVADVGIAMGKNGTHVTRKVADLILVKDYIPALLSAIREGRAVQQDIKKAVDYIAAQNLSEILFTFFAVTFGLGEPLTPIQFLWINLVTDIFPELALAQEPAEENILRRSPESKRASMLTSKDYQRISWESLVLSLASLLGYLYGLKNYGAGAHAKTLGFMTLTSDSLLYTLSARSENVTILDRKKIPENQAISRALAFGFGAEVLAMLSPWFRSFLGTTSLNKSDVLVSGLSALLPLVLIEGSKFVKLKLDENDEMNKAA